MPALTLGAFAMASIARLTRSAMLDVLRLDYINTARAKGLSNRRVIWKHALKNAAIPVVTILGLHFGALLGGAVVTETVFSWPGIGRLAIQGYTIVTTRWCRQRCSSLRGFRSDKRSRSALHHLDPRIRYE
jgi:ABC-type dipeptide/oligopeptide/nickel transport system permease component